MSLSKFLRYAIISTTCISMTACLGNTFYDDSYYDNGGHYYGEASSVYAMHRHHERGHGRPGFQGRPNGPGRPGFQGRPNGSDKPGFQGRPNESDRSGSQERAEKPHTRKNR